ncbi:MAG: CehA/McbA family metallohydrolase [bacterium]|nr:CehA/McbA family metallohydrolase [bacterium]
MSYEYNFIFDFTEKDTKQHFPITFEVKEGIKEIIIRGSYKPETADRELSRELAKSALKIYLSQGDMPLDVDALSEDVLDRAIKEFIPVRNLINFRIFDPLGNFRGTGDNRISSGIPIKIGETISSFGCVSGKIYPGIWRVIIETHAIINKCLLELKIELNKEEKNVAMPDLANPYKPVWTEYKPKRGWVKGDFHSHTKHSDGSLSIEELVQNAIGRGLDFIFLTDHNKISGWETAREERFPLFPGIEFTTFWGHFTAFGVTKYIEWDKINPDKGIVEISELVHSQGGLFCVAHPFTIGDPVCTGCRCTIDVDWQCVDTLEVWAGTFSQRRHENTETLKLWRNLLSQGYKITGIGSTDIHSLKDLYPDVPMTFVLVEDLTLGNVLNSIKMGRVYVSRGPKVEFSIGNAEIGGSISVSKEPIDLRYSISIESDLKVIYNGYEVNTIRNTKSGDIEFIPEYPGYVYLEFWKNKELIALTNPIFIGN